MKKLILLVILSCGLVNCSYANDISVSETRHDVTGWRMTQVIFDVVNLTCEVEFQKGYTENSVFQPVAENSVLVRFEGEEFNQLVSAINNGSNIKTTIVGAVKMKLGI